MSGKSVNVTQMLPGDCLDPLRARAALLYITALPGGVAWVALTRGSHHASRTSVTDHSHDR